MFELLLTMLERLGIIVTVAFLVTRLPFFRHMIQRNEISRKHQYYAIAFFGLFGIIGTYSGVTFDTNSLQFNRWAYELSSEEAIANSRVIGIIIAGLLGGYKVGIGAGIISGLHRFSLGGFTAVSCGLSAILAGVLAGYFHKKRARIHLSTALFVGAFAEATQMLVILLVSKPFIQSLQLVQAIGIPMIIANGVGSAIFLLIVKSVVSEEEKVGATQAQKSLRLAEQTLTYLRNGLSPKTAEVVCRIILKEVDAIAISITNQDNILAHIGLADDHHKKNMSIQTSLTKQVLKKGTLTIANQKDIQCKMNSCPLGAAVIAPLKIRDETIGTLKFYFHFEKDISNLDIELIRGLSSLLSNQLEISEAEQAKQLAKEAEIKALQAQISPHFLFNSLNIIVSLIRTNPELARKLIVNLSQYFRKNLTGTTTNWTTLKEELDHVQAYLAIEEARFVDRLVILYDIDQSALTKKIPTLTLQPLVENAIKHGIKDLAHNCMIKLSIKKIDNSSVKIVVKDNGKGIDEERLQTIITSIVDSQNGTGFGLYNVNRRLLLLLGENSRLRVESKLNKGTSVSFKIKEVEMK
ncbi:sensor histidine kinase [Metabacillus litoralis]|uniref:histidine kinase n=1 Tax=Metabacillus litoralis TaxID=152268 RepID=A0A5C6W6G1_9BACI|nr:sensor histidine kinase [Metabacillus litoralis]TXC92135.1 sensor histidine kinase [Metabacillus litoralis]